ncbi:fibrocystin-L-like [Ruditapes philippinarum]|uniref:fibrocystin-L-like n=1 Tax=Ruditapes philippinarum TaxID=129788 RepID=UPI00295C386F|nr:fibrocystin-L-like [Ruditapes philippinarum]
MDTGTDQTIIPLVRLIYIVRVCVMFLLVIFEQNSAHSLRGYGLLIYKDYFPNTISYGSVSNFSQSIFNGFFAWNNKKGAIAGNIGKVQFVNFILIQNRLAGIEINTISNVPRYTSESPSILNSIIAGKANIHQSKDHGCTSGGIILPLGRGFIVQNVIFSNFNDSNSAAFRWTRNVPRHCSRNCGGFTYHLEGIMYINVPNKAIFYWDWEGILLDIDGSSTMKSNSYWTVLPTTGTIPPDCEHAEEFSIGNNASICPPNYKWSRFAFNSYHVNSKHITGITFTIANIYGISSLPYIYRGFTHQKGWMCALLSNTSYKLHVENMSPANNISYRGMIYDFRREDFLFITMNIPDFPDYFSIGGGKNNATTERINHENSTFGEWNWHNFKKELTFIVKEPAESSIQHQSEHDTVDIPIDLGIYKCFYIDCVPPPDPNISPPVNHTPLNYQYWHDKSIWNRTNDGYMTNVGKIGNHLPVDFDNVKIISYTWVLVNFTNICKLNTLLLYGVLEFVNGHDAAYTIEAGLIIIKGGRLIIGWPDNPFIGHASIIMYGNDSLSAFNPKTGVLLRRKTIGVFGGFDLFGRETGTSWTNLKFSANTGDRKIVLSEKVQWLKGDEIVISPTGFGPWQSETFKIISIGNDQSTIELNDTLKFKHIVHKEVLQSGQIITLKAAVGLLTRNIKIVDANPKTVGGARVLVGLFKDNGKTYKGYTRLSNVEFYHTGSKNSYPSHSLTFIDVGQVNYIKPSVVANCSFHKSISTAIGLIGIRNISLVNNVVYDAYDNGIMTDALSTKLVRNLVIKVRNVGIDAMKSQNLILQDNHVTSSSKIAYHVPAIGCDDTGNIYRNNKMYSNVRGAVLSNGYFTNSMCVKIMGFVGWKNINIGLLYRGHTIQAVFEENILIENQVGLSADILSNRYRRQSYIDVYVKIRNITFIGQTSSFHCGDMVWFRSNRFMLASFSDRDWHYSDGMVGIVFPQFQTIGGFTKLENVSFVKYGESLCQKNYAITTNVESNELQRPMHSENISLSQVSHANKILFLRSPRTSHFSCYSMECDVVRFAVYTDIDGSFLQTVGTLIQKSEHTEIDYYHKLPREMTTMLNGSRIPIEQIATYRGVVRNSNCTFEPMWQAYACKDDLSFKLLLIENLDSDARYRQISPIALLADGYIDLLDVPLDNGQCAHHFCTKRNILFNALIVTGRSYKIHFTRTTPRKMRYRLLNTGPSEGIKLTVWYSRPNRLDVFVNGDFIIASNARIDRFGRYILSMSRGVEFIPQLANISGTNYFDRSRGEITFIVKGKAQIDIISQETFIVSFGFPALSYSELFGQSIVEHLAAFLDIPLTKVRIVNVVSESINGRSKRSEDDNMVIEIEIGNEPKQEMNMTIEDSIEKSALAELVAKIVNECQLGNISNILGDSIVCGKIEFPPDDIEIATIIYNNEYPVHLYFHDKPEAEYENVLLETQPKIRAFDFEGLNVTNLGTVEYPLANFGDDTKWYRASAGCFERQPCDQLYRRMV